MRCWTCDKEAVGVCRFCGRGICKEHVQTTLYIVSTHTDADQDLNCLAVKDALFCGKCKPIPKPVKIPAVDMIEKNKNGKD